MVENNGAYELSVIVPCFNEEDNIPDIVHKILGLLREATIRGEIILVNDGSTDNTRSVIETISKQHKNILGIHHEQNLGITEAWNSGVKHSRGKYIVTIDADLQYKPEDILVLYTQITKENCDLVQGWRKEYKDNNVFRKLPSRALSYVLNLLFFTRINDIKSGFVIYKREVFSDILKERSNFRFFQHFFILCALKKGYRFQQVPITFYPRLRGNSFIKNPVLFSLKVLLEFPRAIVDFGVMTRRKTRR